MKHLVLILALGIYLPVIFSQTPTLLNPSNTTIFNKCDTVTERGYNWWSCGALLKGELFSVYKSYTGLQPDDSMHVYSTWEDSITILEHVKYLQYYKGIPIENAFYIEHSLRDTVILSNGFLVEAMNNSSTPNVTDSVALDSALAFIDAELYAWEDSMEYYLKYDSLGGDTTYYPKGELVWTMISDSLHSMNDQSNYILAWKFDIRFINYLPDTLHGNYTVYINANNGTVLKYIDNYVYGSFNHFKYGTRSFDTRYYHNKYFLETDDDGIRVKTKNRSFWGSYKVNYLPDDGDDNWGNDYWAATASHWGVQEAWKYWRDVWKTNGIDHGALTIHVHADSKEGTHFDPGKQKGSSNIVIGRSSNGYYDGVADIIGHEYTHGIIEHSSHIATNFEAGALGESYADIFGYLFKKSLFGSTNWTIGEDSDPVYKRDFKNPQNVASPSGCQPLYPRYYMEPSAWAFASCDVGGSRYTHHNLAVQNQCFYLLSEGGTLNSITVSGIGIDKAAVIAKYAMTNLLGSRIFYSDSREAWVTAAILIYGRCSNEHLQTCKAWAACNVGATCFCYPSPISCDRPILRYTGEMLGPKLEVNINKLGELITLYPNPSNDKININWGILYNYSKGIPVKINIVNQFGVNVLSLESNMEELSSIDISSLGSGIYSLCINFEEVNFRYKILKL